MVMTTIQESHLVAELDAWCALQGIEPMSTDELMEDGNLTDYQLTWLKDYNNRWCWLESDKFWIVGRLRHPDAYAEQTTWYKSQQFADLVDTWGKPLIPEGYVAEWQRITSATSWRL